jgi:hypothetical protein
MKSYTLELLKQAAQLWVSDDGLDWKKILFEPDSRMQFGIRELIATDEALYIGTAYNPILPPMRDSGLQVFKLVSYEIGGAHNESL